MARQLYTARLQRKTCISDPAQCFHLEFQADELPSFDFAPGQFVSCVADDPNGKSQTRAYSIASAPRGNGFDLCVNRVEGGFFSNLLCDLEPGDTVQFHGPHGLFILRQPADRYHPDCHWNRRCTHARLRAASVSTRRSRSQPKADRCGSSTALGYETELYYRDYFEQVAARHTNFHYIASLSRAAESWNGHRGYVQEFVGKIAEEHAASCSPQIRNRRRACRIQHSCLHLRAERDGFGQSRTPDEPRLAEKADHLRTLRLDVMRGSVFSCAHQWQRWLTSGEQRLLDRRQSGRFLR